MCWIQDIVYYVQYYMYILCNVVVGNLSIAVSQHKQVLETVYPGHQWKLGCYCCTHDLFHCRWLTQCWLTYHQVALNWQCHGRIKRSWVFFVWYQDSKLYPSQADTAGGMLASWDTFCCKKANASLIAFHSLLYIIKMSLLICAWLCMILEVWYIINDIYGSALILNGVLSLDIWKLRFHNDRYTSYVVKNCIYK